MATAGPQTAALNTEAQELFYGGAAGGGKTDLLIGLALTQHRRSLLIRAEAAQLAGIRDRMTEIVGHDQGLNWQDKRWTLGKKTIEFGGCKDPGDERRFQGRAHDLKAFDELPEIRQEAYTFIKTWNRGGAKSKVRNRVVAAGNPPTTFEGEWVIRHWAPWLNPDYQGTKAQDGELRWFAQIGGEDVEVEGPGVIERSGEKIVPMSRTFIQSRVYDNVFLYESGYTAILQALPEPLRSKLLQGDFTAKTEDDPWQVIPSDWVDAAMNRWQADGHKADMTAMGVDVARGGKDRTVIAPRHGWWYDNLKSYPGTDTPDGAVTAGLIIAERRNAAGVGIDVVGVGSSAYDHLAGNEVAVIPISGAKAAIVGNAPRLDLTRQMGFNNVRSWLWWNFREKLDPKNRYEVALPPDNELKRELCAPRWRAKTAPANMPYRVVCEVESKYGAEGWNIIKRTGRSPDKADAVVMAAHPEISPGQGGQFRKIEYPELGLL